MTKCKHKRPNPIYAARKLVYLPRDERLAHKKYVDKTPAERANVDRIWVKTGTKIIDNVWRQLKTKHIPKELEVNENKIEEYVREGQRKHWLAEDDAWKAMGEVVHSAMC